MFSLLLKFTEQGEGFKKCTQAPVKYSEMYFVAVYGFQNFVDKFGKKIFKYSSEMN